MNAPLFMLFLITTFPMIALLLHRGIILSLSVIASIIHHFLAYTFHVNAEIFRQGMTVHTLTTSKRSTILH